MELGFRAWGFPGLGLEVWGLGPLYPYKKDVRRLHKAFSGKGGMREKVKITDVFCILLGGSTEQGNIPYRNYIPSVAT